MIVDHTDVPSAFRRLALPFTGAMVGDQLLGIADTIVIGSLGADALAAATAATTAFAALAITLNGLHAGTGVLAAQAVGAEDAVRFGRIVRSAAIAPFVVALCCVVAGHFFADTLIVALVGPLHNAHAAALYFALRCVSLVPMVASGLAIAALGAAGNTKFVAALLLVVNVVHIPLLLVLALGLGTHHAFGLVGAGISSLFAETIAAAYALIELARQRQLRIFARFDLDRALALQTFVLSLPEMVYLLLVLVPEVAIIAFLAPLGASTVAAYRALAIVSDLTFAIPLGLETAAQTVIGQRFGAGDAEGARNFQRSATRYGVLLSTLAGLVVAATAWPLSAVVTWNAALASIAALPLALHMLTLPLKGYAFLGLAPIRAAGDTRFSLIVGVVASGAVIPLAWYAITALHLGLFAVPFAWIGGWLLWCGLIYARLRRFDWAAGRI
jgi:MATE family multidrug resistance protein